MRRNQIVQEYVKNNLIPDDKEYGSTDETILSEEGEEVVHAVHPQVAQDACLPLQAGSHLSRLVDIDAGGVDVVSLQVDLHLIQAAFFITFSCCHHLLDQLLQPDAKICCSKVDQPKPARPLPLVQVHPVVEEEEVGLEEDEDDLGGRPHCQEKQAVGRIARRTNQLLLEVASHFDPRVDERSYASDDGAKSEEERAVFCGWFWQQ